MSEGHIYVYGEITSYQDDDADLYGAVNLKNVVKQIQNNSNADELTVHLNSPGGDVYEGFAIHDALRNSGKKVRTIIEGMCASIATVIALAGDEREMTENSQFMIHNPWGMTMGDSTEVKKYADQLEKEESRLADFYAKKTGLDVDDIRAMMKEETFMNSSTAKEKGFITNIITDIKAVAKLTINKKEEMTTEDLKKENDSLFAKINNLFSKFNSPKALMLIAGDGTELDFGEDIKEQSEIVVGTKVSTADGSDLKEEYPLPDGTVLKIESGAVSEVVEPVREGEEDVQALKDKIAELEGQLNAKAEAETEAINAKEEAETKMNGLLQEVTEMKSLVSDFKDEFEKQERITEPVIESKVNRNILK